MVSILRLTTLLWAVSTASAAACPPGWSRTDIIGPYQSNDTSVVKYNSTTFGLDAPHVSPINKLAYEWFYFDAVSDDGKYAVVAVFYTAPATAFPGGGPTTNILPVSFSVAIPGQGTFYKAKPSAEEVVVKSVGNGASGDWVGTGLSFTGNSDLSHYKIHVDTDEVTGSVDFKSIATPHYACGPAVAGQDMQAIPNLGWAVGIPDSIAEVNLIVNGTDVTFTGVGYHDKNWGDIPFLTALQTSVWGHGRLGPYSIVWSEVIHRATGKHYTAGYISLKGEVLSYGCTGFKITPSKVQNFAEYHVEVDLGKKGIFEFDLKEVLVIDGADAAGYARRTGLMSGGIKGGKKYDGVSVHEHFGEGLV